MAATWVVDPAGQTSQRTRHITLKKPPIDRSSNHPVVPPSTCHMVPTKHAVAPSRPVTTRRPPGPGTSGLLPPVTPFTFTYYKSGKKACSNQHACTTPIQRPQKAAPCAAYPRRAEPLHKPAGLQPWLESPEQPESGVPPQKTLAVQVKVYFNAFESETKSGRVSATNGTGHGLASLGPAAAYKKMEQYVEVVPYQVVYLPSAATDDLRL